DVEIRGRPEVDDDRRTAVATVRGERVRDAIRADLRGIVDSQAHAGLDAGADDERGPVEITLREPRERGREGRDDRPEHERVDLVEREIFATEQRVDHHRKLVFGLILPGRGPPCRNELRPVIRGENLHARGRDEQEFRGGHEVDHLDLRSERTVHVRHLELKLEVGKRADPAHDEARATGARELDLQAIERADLDVGVLRARLAHQLDTLVRRKDRLLREIPPDADDHAVEEARGALDDVDVSVRRWIEGTRIDSYAITHAVAIPPWRARRTRRVTLAGGKRSGCAEAFCDRAQDLHCDLAVLVEHISELTVSEDEAAHRRGRLHGGGARPVVDESDLSEKITRAEGSLALDRIHLGTALEDDEEVAAALPFFGQDLPGREVDLIGARGDEGK